MRRLISLALTLLLLAGCAPSQPVDADQSAGISQPPAQSEPDPVSPVEPEPEPEPVVAHLMVAGDIMSHMPLTNDAWNGEKNAYDYVRIISAVQPIVSGADYAVVNLETTLAGGPPYSGYP